MKKKSLGSNEAFSYFILHTSYFFIALLLLVTSAHAQLTGSISIGGESTNNVESLDTTSPDNILLPAFELSYAWRVATVSSITLTGSYTPSIYSINPDLSYNAIGFGATGVFYLTNTDDIAAETSGHEKNAKPSVNDRSSTPPMNSHLIGLPARRSEEMQMLPFAGSSVDAVTPELSQTGSIRSAISDNDADRNDSLVQIAISALYTLSGELDSTDIPSKGISKSRVTELEALRDSISDALSGVADVLDSIGYSESVAQIITPELEHLQAPMAKLLPQTKPSRADPTLLASAINALKQAKPESDFLQTAPLAIPSTSSPKTRNLLTTLEKPTPLPGTNENEKPTPSMMLITSSTRLRDFGYGDADIIEDADDSNATTLASTLTIPVAYSKRTGRQSTAADSVLFGGVFPGNPNDYASTSFGAAFETMPSSRFSLRPSYEYTRITYPFDSVYTNSENRLRLGTRIELAAPTVLFGEFSLGLRHYLDPLQEIVRVGVLRGRPDTTFQAGASNFSQYSFGFGLAEFIGERWVLGALAAFNDNPNLRAYVTDALTIAKRRAAPQVADDEYTYNLQRFAVFSNARIFWDMDFGTDLSYEHRQYGSVAARRIKGLLGGVVGGLPGRTEVGRFLNASLLKLFPLGTRLAGLFDSFTLEGVLQLADVSSSDPVYSYNETALTLTASLGF